MKSIYKTTAFIIGIAMLSIVFVACGSSEDEDAPESAPVPELSRAAQRLHQSVCSCRRSRTRTCSCRTFPGISGTRTCTGRSPCSGTRSFGKRSQHKSSTRS